MQDHRHSLCDVEKCRANATEELLQSSFRAAAKGELTIEVPKSRSVLLN